MPGIVAYVLVEIESPFVAADAKAEVRRAPGGSPASLNCLHIVASAVPAKRFWKIAKAFLLYLNCLAA
jgi:hypothetical protein